MTLGGNIVTDAFGVVAMVAMTPLITIQVMGLYAKLVNSSDSQGSLPEQLANDFEMLDDDAIIEL